MPARLAALTTLCRAISSVDDHALEFGGLDRLDLHRRLDGGLDQQLKPLLADCTAKATDLRGIARQPGLEVVEPAEELPVQVLAPALDQFLVAEVEGILQVDQAGHEPNRQPRPPRVAHAATELHLVFAKHVTGHTLLRRTVLSLELGGQRRLDQGPRQPRGQHSQRVPQIDHLVQA
jgi:hypothetical protein